MLIPAAAQVCRLDAAAYSSSRWAVRHFGDGGWAHAATEKALYKGKLVGCNFCVLRGELPASCSSRVFKGVTGWQVKEELFLGLVSRAGCQLADRKNCFVDEDELTLER